MYCEKGWMREVCLEQMLKEWPWWRLNQKAKLSYCWYSDKMRTFEFWEDKAELETNRYGEETITWAENRAK